MLYVGAYRASYRHWITNPSCPDCPWLRLRVVLQTLSRAGMPSWYSRRNETSRGRSSKECDVLACKFFPRVHRTLLPGDVRAQKLRRPAFPRAYLIKRPRCSNAMCTGVPDLNWHLCSGNRDAAVLVIKINYLDRPSGLLRSRQRHEPTEFRERFYASRSYDTDFVNIFAKTFFDIFENVFTIPLWLKRTYFPSYFFTLVRLYIFLSLLYVLT